MFQSASESLGGVMASNHFKILAKQEVNFLPAFVVATKYSAASTIKILPVILQDHMNVFQLIKKLTEVRRLCFSF